MNLLELCVGVAAIGGALAGANFGARVGGLAGAVAGLIIGGFGAIFAVAFGLAGLGAAFTLLERARRRRQLSRTLGRYWELDRVAAWRRLKDALRGGQAVRGKVAAVCSSHLLIDIGAGFPVSLSSWEIDGHCTRRFCVGDDVEALVLRFDEADRAIVATTRPRHWVIWDGTPVGWSWSDPSTALPGAPFHCDWLTNTARQRLEDFLSYTNGVFCALIRGDDLARAPYRGGCGRASSARVWVELRRDRLIARQPPLTLPSAGQPGSGAGVAHAECGIASIGGPATQVVLPPKFAE
jgi:hypothetical protein